MPLGHTVYRSWNLRYRIYFCELPFDTLYIVDIELHVFDYHSSIVTPKNIKKFFEKNYVSPRSTRRTALRSLALCLDSHPPHRSGLCLLGCLRPHCLHFFQLVGAIYSLALLITIVDSGSFLITGTLSDRMIHSLYVVLLSEVIHLYSMELYTAKVHSWILILF